VSVQLHEPVFAAGTRVAATLTLSRAPPRAHPPAAPVRYCVAQVAGRWTSDRAWVRPDAHAPSSPSSLDLHGSASTPDAPWDAALHDASRTGGGGGRQGHAGLIFRSAPLVVCSNEPVPAGSSTSFTVTCVLPDALPATLRGTALRYSYTLIVVVALADESQPRTLRVPFRVVTPASAPSASPPPVPVPTPRDAGPSPSRFLEENPAYALAMTAALSPLPPAASGDIDVALALSRNGRLTPYGSDAEMWKPDGDANHETPLSFIRSVPATPQSPATPVATTTPRSSVDSVPPVALSALAHENVDEVGDDEGSDSSADEPFDVAHAAAKKIRYPSVGTAIPLYHISRGPVSVARMYLPNRVHNLGDTLTAVFDFHGSGSPCYRLNARLECQEIVQPSVALGTKYADPGSSIVFRKVYGEHGEFVMHNRNSHVTFSIPHDAPVSFATAAVHVRWLIHFVFLVPKAADRPPQQTPPAVDMDASSTDEAEQTNTESLLANSTVSNAEEVDVVLASKSDWSCEWGYLPQRDTDALQWTLPLTVTSRQGSGIGTCASAQLRF
jgi:Rgp1